MYFQGNTWCSITSSFTDSAADCVGLQIYDPISQEGHVRKKGVVSMRGTIFNTSNKGIAKHHIDPTKNSFN